MATAADVASHYSNGGLQAAIESGLAALGKTLSSASIADLAPVDEFHIGGRGATVDICEQLHVQPGSAVLDVGCGIGGTARFISSTFGCEVTGIDLTAEYVEVARSISEATHMADQLTFETGNALDMPFVDSAFDIATQLHVGMNIDDKAALFAEVHRVVRPGGRFGVYDIMRLTDGSHVFPVPWASDETMSFVAALSDYQAALRSAGFRILASRERGQFARDFFAALKQHAAQTDGPSPIGLHLILGDDAPTKIANMVAAVTAGILAPTEIVCERLA